MFRARTNLAAAVSRHYTDAIKDGDKAANRMDSLSEQMSREDKKRDYNNQRAALLAKAAEVADIKTLDETHEGAK